MLPPLVTQSSDGTFEVLRAGTLHGFGLREDALEAAIHASPELLALEDAGVMFGATHVVRQARFRASTGRQLRPDLLILTDHGDVVVVEVKRFGNPELNGRHVVAQVVDYAAALASLSEDDLVRITGGGPGTSWKDTVRSHFPNARNPGAIANKLRRNLSDGEILLVIACDRAPDGIGELVRAAAQQRAMAFQLRVVEITPYRHTDGGPVTFVPHTAVETEIIARTTVTVRDESAGGRVVVQIDTASAEEIQEAEKSPKERGSVDRRALAALDRNLDLQEGTSLEEMRLFTARALAEDWSGVNAALAWPGDDPAPWRDTARGGQWSHWGRYGIGVGGSRWMPGLFVGWLVDGHDHRVTLDAADEGPDFAVILSVNRKVETYGFKGDNLFASPEWHALLTRLQQTDFGPLRFHDHLAETARPNRWHPIHLRASMASIFSNTTTQEQRYQRWLDVARDVTEKVIQGREFEALRARVLPTPAGD